MWNVKGREANSVVSICGMQKDMGVNICVV